MEEKEEVSLALQWFADNDISAYCDERPSQGSIYVQVGDCDLQISSVEISYRAELQKEFSTH
jgi:hypothetical protein